MQNCETCNASMFDKPLFRNGPSGRSVPWRCYEHLDLEYREKISIDTMHLVDVITDA